jgi:hypothetical protein
VLRVGERWCDVCRALGKGRQNVSRMSFKQRVSRRQTSDISRSWTTHSTLARRLRAGRSPSSRLSRRARGRSGTSLARGARGQATRLLRGYRRSLRAARKVTLVQGRQLAYMARATTHGRGISVHRGSAAAAAGRRCSRAGRWRASRAGQRRRGGELVWAAEGGRVVEDRASPALA